MQNNKVLQQKQKLISSCEAFIEEIKSFYRTTDELSTYEIAKQTLEEVIAQNESK